MARNITLYPWFKFSQNLVFWQAVWFLYFQNALSAAAAITMYAIYDISTTLLEVPSGYMSDRLGRRKTLIAAGAAMAFGSVLLALGGSFWAFALAQVLIGASAAFASGTDSAMLYESLESDGRAHEIEAHELRAWRFTFIALALSAAIGGLLAQIAPTLPFWASFVACLGMCIIAVQFKEPGGAYAHAPSVNLRAALVHPVLVWLFVLGIVMYVFSHLPFVFGQPFILEALRATGLQSNAAWVSGLVSAIMMVLSVITSLIAPRLRDALGLAGILLFAFALQIGLVGVLSLTNATLVIALLFLRMVPDSLSRPFIMARIQPVLSKDSRATYLSLRSFFARLVFAGSLLAVAGTSSRSAEMAYDDIQIVLWWYLAAGVLCFVGLAWGIKRSGIAAIEAPGSPEAETGSGPESGSKPGA